MKPQTLIIPLSRPKYKKAYIPDAEADYWLTKIRYQTDAESTNKTEMIVVVPPITGWRRLLIKWRLWNQYCAECRAAAV